MPTETRLLLEKYKKMIWEQSLEIEVLTEELAKAKRYNTLYLEQLAKKRITIAGMLEDMRLISLKIYS